MKFSTLSLVCGFSGLAMVFLASCTKPSQITINDGDSSTNTINVTVKIKSEWIPSKWISDAQNPNGHWVCQAPGVDFNGDKKITSEDCTTWYPLAPPYSLELFDCATVDANGVGSSCVLKSNALTTCNAISGDASRCQFTASLPNEARNHTLCARPKVSNWQQTLPICSSIALTPSPKQVNLLLFIHAGEGSGGSDCFMQHIDGSPNKQINSTRYKACRDSLKEIARELADLNIKGIFQFHGAFLDLLAQDVSSFSFATDLVDLGHEVAFHDHYECHKDVAIPGLCEAVPKGDSWGWAAVDLVEGDGDDIGRDENGNSDPSDFPTFEMMEVRHRSLQYVASTLFPSRFPEAIKVFGGHGLDHRFSVNEAQTVDSLVKSGISTIMGGTVPNRSARELLYPKHFCEGLVHSIKPVPVEAEFDSKKVSIDYLEAYAGPLFGSLTTNENEPNGYDHHLTYAEKIKNCVLSNTGGDQIFEIGYATHLHNFWGKNSNHNHTLGMRDLKKFYYDVSKVFSGTSIVLDTKTMNNYREPSSTSWTPNYLRPR